MDLEYAVEYFMNHKGGKLASPAVRFEAFKLLCEYFGHPELSCPCIHVAGSKGKGSITTMAGNILKSAGFKTVGLYRSPAITHFTDRISEVDSPFSPEVYKKAFDILKAGIENLRAENRIGRLTYYELVTLYGFLVFKEAGCDFAVFEVGVGGEYDATNVVQPKSAIINTIELEHTEKLGSTLEEIARAKAGIIKENIPTVIGPQTTPGVKTVFKAAAKEKHAELLFIPDCLKTEYYLDDDNHLRMHIDEIDVSLRLPGSFQATNALAAKLAVKLAVPTITETAIKNGLERAWLPGRFEVLSSRELINYPKIPYLIMDGAHTARSAAGTMDTLAVYRGLMAKQKTYDSCLTDFTLDEKPLLLFACAKDKKVGEIAKALAPHFSEVFLTSPGGFKTPDLPRLKSAFIKTGLKTIYAEDYNFAIKTALQTANSKSLGLVVLGSFYLVGEVKNYLVRSSGSPW
ncbi:bifunctional folylpolyglutamate synthase/dihydrofolate synthase [Candidatus Saccharibacteria bacterium]|nr:bifunctional folylpolyglutamate synthase/dihydrofolate synthase [Candidatus Saccharibacteria bacterium]